MYTTNSAPDNNLTVIAEISDGGVLSYQWYRSDTDSNTGGVLVSTDGPFFTPPTDTEGTVYYYVVITNTNSAVNGAKTTTVRSNPAKIVVNNKVNAKVPDLVGPQDGTYIVGDLVVLTVAATVEDNGVLTYQWYRSATKTNSDGTAIPGATFPFYQFATTATGEWYYYVVVTNTNSAVDGEKVASVTSSAVSVTVKDVEDKAPKITASQLDSKTYPQYGDADTLRVTATGDSLTYQWYKNGAEIPGATSNSYTPPTTDIGTTYYYVEITNTYNTVLGPKTAKTVSRTIAITVGVNAQTPTITTQPQGGTFPKNALASLTVAASISDDGDLSYQWYKNGVAIPGAISKTYELPVDELYEADYYVVVTNTNSGVNGNQVVTKTSQTVKVIVAQSYVVRFYNDDLELIREETVLAGQINPASIYGSGTWYLAGNPTASPNHELDGDVNFYISNGLNVVEVSSPTVLRDILINPGDSSKRYALEADIDLSSGGSLVLSGTFRGYLNGNGHKIKGLRISGSNSWVGLFSTVVGGTIKNLNIELDSQGINGDSYIGAIAGYISTGSTIDNVTVTGNINGIGSDIGGIAGVVNYGAKITNSYFEGNINGEGDDVGGIAGWVDSGSEITGSYSKGDISGTGINVGGIAGLVQGGAKITNSYSEGDISGVDDVGGIAGWVNGGSEITGSHSKGDISGTGFVGGIAGKVENSEVTNSYSEGSVSGNEHIGGIAGLAHFSSIIKNYSTGDIIGTGNNVGGIAGWSTSGTITHNVAINPYVNGLTANRVVGRADNYGTPPITQYNFALEETTVNGDLRSDTDLDGAAKTAVELKTKATYESLGWNIPAIWKIDAGKNGGYPYLYWQEL